MQRNVNDWERIASLAAASFLLWSAWKMKKTGADRARVALTAAGLIGRAASGYCPINAVLGRGRHRDDTRRALGGSRGTFLRERVIVRAPVEKLYSFWRDPANLPSVMPYLERVEPINATRSHWTIAGPAGTCLEWDAEVINEVPLETIGWQSLPGADVASAGSVHFRELGDGLTEVVVTMQYDPPAGRLGASMAGLVGASAGQRVQRALQEFKRSMEAMGPRHSLAAI
jgi:uncharacterized membrane protein